MVSGGVAPIQKSETISSASSAKGKWTTEDRSSNEDQEFLSHCLEVSSLIKMSEN